MSFTYFRIILAVILLGLATYIFVIHRVPSGMTLMPAILAALGLSVSRQSRVICYWAIDIVVLDPMNWFILAVGLREALGRVRKES
jgi:hypothetical protein